MASCGRGRTGRAATASSRRCGSCRASDEPATSGTLGHRASRPLAPPPARARPCPRRGLHGRRLQRLRDRPPPRGLLRAGPALGDAGSPGRPAARSGRGARRHASRAPPGRLGGVPRPRGLARRRRGADRHLRDALRDAHGGLHLSVRLSEAPHDLHRDAPGRGADLHAHGARLQALRRSHAMKPSLALAALLLLPGCATLRAEHALTGQPFVPTGGEVRVVMEGAPSPGPFSEIAIVTATGTLGYASLPSVLEALKSETARLGGDAVIRVRYDRGTSGATATGVAVRLR